MIIEFTEQQAENLTNFIESELLDAIRRDESWDNFDYLVNIVDVYKKLKLPKPITF